MRYVVHMQISQCIDAFALGMIFDNLEPIDNQSSRRV